VPDAFTYGVAQTGITAGCRQYERTTAEYRGTGQDQTASMCIACTGCGVAGQTLQLLRSCWWPLGVTWQPSSV
jgi:hypothetical protein